MPTTIWIPLLILVGVLAAPVIALAIPLTPRGGVGGWVTRQSLIISTINRAVGTTVAWLTLFMVLAQFAVVVMRYIYGVNFIALQESILYAHGLMFTLAAGYTLLVGGHVRVDIFHQNMSPRMAALVDFLGSVFFLVPFMLTVLYFSWDYVANAWRIQEVSRESSGLPYLYLLKTVLLVFALLLLAEGISMAGRAALTLRGIPLKGADNGSR